MSLLTLFDVPRLAFEWTHTATRPMPSPMLVACLCIMFSRRLIPLHKFVVFTGNRAHAVARTPGRQVNDDPTVYLHTWLLARLSVERGCRVEPHVLPHRAVCMDPFNSRTSFATLCSLNKGRTQA